MSAVNAPHPTNVAQNKRKFVAWRFRLTEGAREASHTELEGAESWLENFGTICGAMVFFGVAFEVFIAAENSPYGSILERWGSSVADAFVALGVLGEVLASARGRTIQGELTRRSNKELAAANERAGKAEKAAAEARERTAEVERLTAWRHISQEQADQILPSLIEVAPKLDVLIEWESGDPEAFSYANEIARLFNAAGATRIRGASNSILIGPAFGVFISVSEEIRETGIAVKFVSTMSFWQMGQNDLSTHLPRGSVPPNIYVFAGPKMPTDFSLVQLEVIDAISPTNANVIQSRDTE